MLIVRSDLAVDDMPRCISQQIVVPLIARRLELSVLDFFDLPLRRRLDIITCFPEPAIGN